MIVIVAQNALEARLFSFKAHVDGVQIADDAAVFSADVFKIHRVIICVVIFVILRLNCDGQDIVRQFNRCLFTVPDLLNGTRRLFEDAFVKAAEIYVVVDKIDGESGKVVQKSFVFLSAFAHGILSSRVCVFVFRLRRIPRSRIRLLYVAAAAKQGCRHHNSQNE